MLVKGAPGIKEVHFSNTKKVVDSVERGDVFIYILMHGHIIFIIVWEQLPSFRWYHSEIAYRENGEKLDLQYIPRNMHTVFALLCFVVVIHWLIFPYPSGLLHWHCGNLTIVPVPAKQPWWIWKNTSCAFIMNDCITTTKQSTTKPCAYFLGYTVRFRQVMSGHTVVIRIGWPLTEW